MADRRQMEDAIHSFEQHVAKAPETNMNRQLWNWTIDYLTEVERTMSMAEVIVPNAVTIDQHMSQSAEEAL